MSRTATRSRSVRRAGNDIDLTLSGAANGTSTFHVSCSDQEMNGSEDCGTNQGNGKDNDSGINDWLLDGMTGEKGMFDCGLYVGPGGTGGTRCRWRWHQ